MDKLKTKRHASRLAIRKTIEKLMNCSKEEVFDLSVSKKLLQNISNKRDKLCQLDQDILDKTSTENLEEEILQTDDYNEDLDIEVIKLQRIIDDHSTAGQENSTAGQETTETSDLAPTTPNNQSSGDNNASHTSRRDNSRTSVTDSTNNLHTRLPKLTLPKFNGDVLQWQNFWECFTTSIHCNSNLSTGQKFTYLKSLLEDEAARTISGFAITHENYQAAVDLLVERYGQSQKIIHTHMQSLLKLPAPTNDAHSLKFFYDKMETLVRGLESLGQHQESYGALLTPVLLGKLPSKIRTNLARENHENNWDLQTLRKAIYKEIVILEAGSSIQHEDSEEIGTFFTRTAKTRNKSHSATVSTDLNVKRNKCVYCEELHSPANCTKVKDQTQRTEIIRNKKLCFNCFGKHRISECRSRYSCRNCKKRHHTSLCTSTHTTRSNEDGHPSTSTAHEDTSIFCSSVSHANAQVLLKTAVAPVYAQEKMLCTNANILFDEGSQRSFITEDLATRLDFKRKSSESMNVSVFGGNGKHIRHLDCGFINVMTTHGKSIPIEVLVVPTISTPMKNLITQEVHGMKHLRHLHLAHPVMEDDTFLISLLIGADNIWKIVQDKVIRAPRNHGPTAVKSKLGYLLSGPVMRSKVRSENYNVLHIITSHANEEIDLEKFWKLESIGINSKETEITDQAFLQEYQEKQITMINGKYEACLPWKDDHMELPSNYSIAKKRTEATIQRLEKEPKLLQKYGEIIADQEKRGFVEKCEPTERSSKEHYIPHHAVKKDSSTTPIRIVYDCSCRASPELLSLNDCLKSTPPDINDIASILLRFRLGKYALSTDIEKAFLHVGLHEKDRDFTRFFWLSDPTDPSSPLTTYRFKSVLFGATCSPFILNATLLKHLALQKNATADTLARDLYVDNVISSLDSKEEVQNYYKEARNIMNSASFNLRSWTSNCDELRNIAKKENVLDADVTTKILGMRWNVNTDTIAFQQHEYTPTATTTKREVLQESSKIYDPQGLLSPVSIRAKIFMQSLWTRQCDWDEIITSEELLEWKDIAQDLHDASTIKINRHFFTTATTRMSDSMLHIFCDASLKAYGATAYLCTAEDSSLIMAKSRVAPLKKLTLPQIELLAAVLGVRLANYIHQSLKIEHTVYWSDSQIVLHWIAGNKSNNQFVRNRVTEIRQNTSAEDWKYCPTDQNPADLLTRGIPSDDLHQKTLWWKGPHWISRDKDWPQWNKHKMTDEKAIEELTAFTTVTEAATTNIENERGLDQSIDIHRYSSLQKLYRVTAYVTRFINNCRSNVQDRKKNHLTAEEIQASETKWIISCQHQGFPDVFKNMNTSSTKKLSIIKQLHLFQDSSGILRCGGRLHNAPIQDSAKFPILLPAKHQLTNFIIQDAHKLQLHSGTNATITHVRQKFWIPTIRQVCNSLLRKCVTCKKITGRPYKIPDPPPLPEMRLRDSPPFTVTGVDFTGAIKVKDSSGLEKKSYICLFTCASTRAIHLEVMSNLTSQSFLQVFRRFTSRRSTPQIMVSDNATTFIATAKLISELKVKVQEKNVKWHFIPIRAPWFGGWWERLIGITKTTLKKVLGKSCITEEELQTVVTEIEAVLNDRPITYVSSDICDDPLTPSHLLHGRRLTSIAESITTDVNIKDLDFNSPSRRYDLLQNILTHFRNRWKKEYLTSLREFHKVTGYNKQNVQVGDVILIQDEIPRRFWKLGKIITIHKSSDDGLIRSATVQTAKGTSKRPIAKLIPLEVNHPTFPPNTDNRSDDMGLKRTERTAAKEAKEKIKQSFK